MCEVFQALKHTWRHLSRTEFWCPQEAVFSISRDSIHSLPFFLWKHPRTGNHSCATMMKALTTFFLVLWSLLPLAKCFSVSSSSAAAQDVTSPCFGHQHSSSSGRGTMLHLFENDQEEEKQSEGKIVGDGKDDASTIDSSDLYSALNARKREFARGIGKVSSEQMSCSNAG